jgi:hypothetical protein
MLQMFRKKPVAPKASPSPSGDESKA